MTPLGRLLVLALVTSACRREQTKAPITIDVDCGESERQLEVTGEVELDDTVCGVPWKAWQLDTSKTMELVRRIPNRRVWLRSSNGRIDAELRTPQGVAATFTDVTLVYVMTDKDSAAARPLQVDVVRGELREELGLRELRARYPGSQRRQVSVCAIAGPGDPAAIISIEAAGGAARSATRSECERDGWVLQFSNRNEIQLRDRTRHKLLVGIHRIVLPQ